MLEKKVREDIRLKYTGKIGYDDDRSRDARLILLLLDEIEELETQLKVIADKKEAMLAFGKKSE